MATQITSDNFDEYFLGAMENYGKAQENETDVPTVTGSEVAGTNVDHYSMPLVKDQSGVLSYAKVPLGGQNGLIQAVADEVETEGMMQGVTQAQFNAIFGSPSSSSSD